MITIYLLNAKPKKERVKKIKCDECGKYIKETRIQLHKARHNPEPDFILVQVAFKGRLLTYQHNNQENGIDIETYMDIIKEKIVNVIRNALNLHKNIKINLEMECEFMKLESEDFTMIHKFQLTNVILREEDDFWRDIGINKKLYLFQDVMNYKKKNLDGL